MIFSLFQISLTKYFDNKFLFAQHLGLQFSEIDNLEVFEYNHMCKRLNEMLEQKKKDHENYNKKMEKSKERFSKKSKIPKIKKPKFK